MVVFSSDLDDFGAAFVLLLPLFGFSGSVREAADARVVDLGALGILEKRIVFFIQRMQKFGFKK